MALQDVRLWEIAFGAGANHDDTSTRERHLCRGAAAGRNDRVVSHGGSFILRERRWRRRCAESWRRRFLQEADIPAQKSCPKWNGRAIYFSRDSVQITVR